MIKKKFLLWFHWWFPASIIYKFLVKAGFLYSPSEQWAKWAMGEKLHPDFIKYLQYMMSGTDNDNQS